MTYLYDSDFITKHLPQSYPFCLVDRVLEYNPKKEIVCLKNVSINEEYFVGHFPDHKIMPGVLISEALAQTCALLSILDLNHETQASPHGTPPEIAYLASMNIKFLESVIPGDQLILNAAASRTMNELVAFEVVALVDGQIVCQGIIKTTKRNRHSQ